MIKSRRERYDVRGDVVEVVQVEGGWALTAQGHYVCARYLAR